MKCRCTHSVALALLLALIVPLAVACAPPAPESTAPTTAPAGEATSVSSPRRGGTLVVGLQGPVLSLDPADHRDRPTETFLRNIFDGLVTRTPKNEVVLEMAEAANMIDPQTWEFKLKQGIKFHNGDPCTAEDVKFSFDRVITEKGIDYPEPHTAARKGLIAPLERVELVDDYTVRFHLANPWPVFMQMLVHQQIIPKKYFEQVGTKGFLEHPVGCGPFKFVEGKLDDQLVLERFDEYYGGATDLQPVGTAYLDRVIFKVIPETSSRVAALQAGQAQIVEAVPAYLVSQLEADAKFQVQTCTGTRPHFMELNVTQAPFNDARVRRALNYAVDRQLILDTVLGGYGELLPGPLAPGNNYADPSLVPYAFDVDKAKALLKEAGLENGFSFVIDVEAPNKELAEAIAGQLHGNLGLDVSVRVWDWAVLRPKLLAGERMATVGSWGDSAFDPVGYLEAKVHTFEDGTGYGRGNYSLYANARIDELIQQGEVETDTAKRHEIYNEAQRILWEDAPMVFLFVPQEIQAASARVQNWVPSPDGRINLHDVWLTE